MQKNLNKFDLFLIHGCVNSILTMLSDANISAHLRDWRMFKADDTAQIQIGMNTGMAITIDRKEVVLWDGMYIVKQISLLAYKMDFRKTFNHKVLNHYNTYKRSKYDFNLN